MLHFISLTAFPFIYIEYLEYTHIHTYIHTYMCVTVCICVIVCIYCVYKILYNAGFVSENQNRQIAKRTVPRFNLSFVPSHV